MSEDNSTYYDLSETKVDLVVKLVEPVVLVVFLELSTKNHGGTGGTSGTGETGGTCVTLNQ